MYRGLRESEVVRDQDGGSWRLRDGELRPKGTDTGMRVREAVEHGSTVHESHHIHVSADPAVAVCVLFAKSGSGVVLALDEVKVRAELEATRGRCIDLRWREQRREHGLRRDDAPDGQSCCLT